MTRNTTSRTKVPARQAGGRGREAQQQRPVEELLPEVLAWFERTHARPAVRRDVDAMNAFLGRVLKESRPAA